MTPEQLELRIRRGAEFLAAVAEPAWGDWPSGYARYRADELSLIEAMSLAHPRWRPPEVSADEIQGPRQFEADPLLEGLPCEAARIWGYRCDLPSSHYVRQQDHLFPYAMGGPTEAANRLILCAWHNQLKFVDVHLFPWEEVEPDWLRPLLGRLHAHRHSRRLRL